MNPLLLFFLLPFAVSGCGNMSGYDAADKFSCKAPDGVICTSMSGVYENARQHNLPGQNVKHGGQGGKDEEKTVNTGAATANGDVALLAPPYSGTPIRSAPRVLRALFFPWEDTDGDLHDGSYVYLTVDTGHWLIEHNRKRIRDDFAPVRPASTSGKPQAAPRSIAPVSPGEFVPPSSPIGNSNAAAQ